MGIYFLTSLYLDINRKDSIDIANDPIIDQDDMKRGFVLLDELVKFYGDKFDKNQITDQSYLVESMSGSYDTNTEPLITKKLPIK